MLRAVGLVPNNNDEDRTFPISREEFINRVRDANTTGQHAAHDEVVAALQMFDPEQTGMISTANMRNILCNLGDRMKPDEVEMVVEKMKRLGQKGPDGDDCVEIGKFVHVILNEN